MNKILAFTYQELNAAPEEMLPHSPIAEENERLLEAEFEAAIQARDARYYMNNAVYFEHYAVER